MLPLTNYRLFDDTRLSELGTDAHVGRSTWKRQEIYWKVVGLCVLVSAVMQCSSFLVITSIGVMFLFWLPWFVCLLAKLYRVVMKL